MFPQKPFLFLAALGLFERVNAHGRIKTWTITSGGVTMAQNGEDYDAPDTLKTAQRKKPKGLQEPDGFLHAGDPRLACWSTETSSGTTYPVDAGTTVTTQWTHQSDYWPTGHGGPILEYMAACPESGCDNFDSMQAKWFKISENVLYNGQWASNKIMQDGKWDITIPSELKKGKYLLRHEILSVHGVVGTAQIYPFCVQIDLASSGSTVPEETYTVSQIYDDFSHSYLEYQIQAGEGLAPIPSRPFTAPGPPVFNGAGGNGGNSGGSGGTYTGGALNTTVPVTSVLPGAGSPSTAVSGQAGASGLPDPYAPTPPVVPVAGVTAVVAPSVPAVTEVRLPTVEVFTPPGGSGSAASPSAGGPNASVPNAPASPSAGGPNASVPNVPASPSAGGPNASDPNAPASPPPAVGAGAANPAPSIDINLSNKGVDNAAAADGAAVDKTLPAPSGGLEDANAGANTTDGVSASDPPATALAAGANAAAPSVLSSPATAPAVTGASEYASNIQGGKCHSNTWRCQTKADGTMSLDVCGNKDSSVLEWIPSNPLCPSKCDDSKPQNPICE